MRFLAIAALALVGSLLAGFSALARVRGEAKIEPEVQTKLDAWKKTIATWAADPLIVQQVLEQNVRGPITGMTEEKWKVLKPRSAEVKAFEINLAGEFLRQKTETTRGVVAEAFLCGAQGEKVAFTDKTSNYIHKGKAKFDRPFESKEAWQGEPTFDDSSQTDSVQIAVPVLETEKVGEHVTTRSIGVLVVGIDLSKV